MGAETILAGIRRPRATCPTTQRRCSTYGMWSISALHKEVHSGLDKLYTVQISNNPLPRYFSPLLRSYSAIQVSNRVVVSFPTFWSIERYLKMKFIVSTCTRTPWYGCIGSHVLTLECECVKSGEIDLIMLSKTHASIKQRSMLRYEKYRYMHHQTLL